MGPVVLVTVACAGGGDFYFAKTAIEKDDFRRSVQLIAQDDDASWCDLADGQIINNQLGAKFCAIHMPNYAEAEAAE